MWDGRAQQPESVKKPCIRQGVAERQQENKKLIIQDTQTDDSPDFYNQISPSPLSSISADSLQTAWDFKLFLLPEKNYISVVLYMNFYNITMMQDAYFWKTKRYILLNIKPIKWSKKIFHASYG